MKRTLTIILIFILTFALASCGSPTEKPAKEEITDPIDLTISIVTDQESIEAEDFEPIENVSFKANKGMTVLQATELFCISNDIELALDSKGEYVTHLNGLTEKDFSDMTGWSFTLNGEMVNVGAGIQVVEDGDVIQWKFVDFSSVSW